MDHLETMRINIYIYIHVIGNNIGIFITITITPHFHGRHRNSPKGQKIPSGKSHTPESWLVKLSSLTYPPPEMRPYDQGLLSIGFP